MLTGAEPSGAGRALPPPGGHPDRGGARLPRADRGGRRRGARLPDRDAGARARRRRRRPTRASATGGRAVRSTACPIAVKDVLCTRGIRTTCGSKILERFVPPYDATVVARLVEAGAVLLGKLNMDEFAMGSSTENSAFFPTRNPWDLDRVPGGSSRRLGGRGGRGHGRGEPRHRHRRIDPPARGLLRRRRPQADLRRASPATALVAFASSLDQIGPFARTVRGRRRCCSRSSPATIPGLDSRSDHAGARLSRPQLGPRRRGPAHRHPQGVLHRGARAPRSRAAVRRPSSCSRALGAAIVEPVSLPHTEYGLAAYYLIAPAEASSNLARYDGVQYGLRAPGGEDLIDMYGKTPRGGLRRRGQAPHHAGHLRPVAPATTTPTTAGPEGAHARPARLRGGLRARRT